MFIKAELGTISKKNHSNNTEFGFEATTLNFTGVH